MTENRKAQRKMDKATNPGDNHQRNLEEELIMAETKVITILELSNMKPKEAKKVDLDKLMQSILDTVTNAKDPEKLHYRFRNLYDLMNK